MSARRIVGTSASSRILLACAYQTLLFLPFGNVSACRSALYCGRRPRSPACLFTEPTHGLMHQSWRDPYIPGVETELLFNATQLPLRNHDRNQDGWGVGWFDGEGRAQRVRAGRGATSGEGNTPDPELLDLLASAPKSRVLLGHIRAATSGELTEVNSHPFQFNRLLWMHNGGIASKSSLVSALLGRGSIGVKKPRDHNESC